MRFWFWFSFSQYYYVYLVGLCAQQYPEACGETAQQLTRVDSDLRFINYLDPAVAARKAISSNPCLCFEHLCLGLSNVVYKPLRVKLFPYSPCFSNLRLCFFRFVVVVVVVVAGCVFFVAWRWLVRWCAGKKIGDGGEGTDGDGG